MRIGIIILTISILSACTATRYPPRSSLHEDKNYREEGIASWYGEEFKGRKTANGERFNPSALTCAHRSLPFGTRVRVINLENNRDVIVRVNDRGPVRHSRLIDISYAAARTLNFVGQGITRVRVESIP